MNYTEANPCQLMIHPVAAREVSKLSTFLAQSGTQGVTMCKPLSSTWATSLPPRKYSLFYYCYYLSSESSSTAKVVTPIPSLALSITPSACRTKNASLKLLVSINFFCNHLVVTWIINSSMSRQKSLSHEGTFVSNLNHLTLSSLCYIITWNVKI